MQICTVYLSALTFCFTTIVIGNAFYKKKHFYPSIVYVTKSNTSMAVIYIQFFVLVYIFGKLLRKLFLGTLRTTEFEHLLERFWYALTETCLAFTVFRDDFNPRFVALFTVLLFLKSFHWLVEERVDFMERSPTLGYLFHIRVLSLLMVLGCMDYYLLLHAYNSTIIRGPTVQLVFGFEYGILLTVIASIGIKYILHAVEMQAENPWENKAVFLLYTELIIGLIKVLLYVLFVIIMAKIYALPMFVFRPMFFTIRNFKKALSDVIMSRRAIRNMNTLYPDATIEELRLSDNICIICREDMIGNSKKLPCGHIFHASCLRSWFQRQQTCPTCRLNILRNNNIDTFTLRVEAPTPSDNSLHEPTSRSATNENQNITRNSNTALVTERKLPSSFGFSNPMPFLTRYSIPLPIMPSNLNLLTDEELKSLEGNERRNIEERLKLLGNIKLLIDASNILMNQYVMTAAFQPEVIRILTPLDEDNKNCDDVKSDVKREHGKDRKSDLLQDAFMEENLNVVLVEDVDQNENFIDDSIKIFDDNQSELCELRKRRLKYLQESKTY